MIKAKIKMMLKNVGEKLVYMSNKLCNVKTVTVTGTTNSNGAFSLASVANYKNGDEVLSIATNTDANALCVPWVYNKDDWYVSVLHWQSWTQKANTSFTFTVRVKVGGVLRNLSIFKAFRHYMSLQKGGGVDGQTGCKKSVTENSSDAQCSAYSGAHYASRVRNDSRIQWSQPIRFCRCARWLFSACSCCFMEYWSDRYALPLRCVHHFDKRGAVSVQRRKRNKESWYCSSVNALHKEYIALSERRCAA